MAIVDPFESEETGKLVDPFEAAKPTKIKDPFEKPQTVADVNALPERGVLGDIGSALVTGAVVRGPETIGRALRTIDPEGGIDIVRDIGTKAVEFAEKAPEKRKRKKIRQK